MRILILLSAVVLAGCSGSSQSKQETFDVSRMMDSTSYQVDSLAYAYKIMGDAKSELYNDSGAIVDYTKAIEIDPDYAPFYFDRGNSKTHLEMFKEAVEDYSRAIALESTMGEAYYGRGIAKATSGDEKGGMEDFHRAQELTPAYSFYYCANAMSGNQVGALEYYNKALELNPKFVDAYIKRGVLKSEMGDYEGEVEDCRLAMKNCLPSASIYDNLGRAFLYLESFKESIEAYDDGIKIFPRSGKLYLGRGLARLRSGDKRGACEDWRKSKEQGCMDADDFLPICEDCEPNE